MLSPLSDFSPQNILLVLVLPVDTTTGERTGGNSQNDQSTPTGAYTPSKCESSHVCNTTGATTPSTTTTFTQESSQGNHQSQRSSPISEGANRSCSISEGDPRIPTRDRCHSVNPHKQFRLSWRPFQRRSAPGLPTGPRTRHSNATRIRLQSYQSRQQGAR